MSEDNLNALPIGVMLHEYKIISILGSGGFGITYLASDTKLNMKVAIKEYLPNDLVVRRSNTVLPKSTGDGDGFQWGLDRFLDEAKTLARFNHPNVVQVLRFFEANSTAYMVMRYEDGLPLNEILEKETLTEDELVQNILLPLLDGLKQVHAAGFLHRDIKPGNIYMRRSDETPVLLDFGAARNALGSKSKSLTSIVTAGYAPFEQYHSDGNQGPWSDIYALGAVAYRIVTGERLPEAPGRLKKDKMIPAVEAANGKYSESLLMAIDHALAVDEEDRPQSCEDWKRELTAKNVTESVTKPEKMVEQPSNYQNVKADASEENTRENRDDKVQIDTTTSVKKTGRSLKFWMAMFGGVILLIGAAAFIPQLGNQTNETITQADVPFQLDSKKKKLSYAIGLDIGKTTRALNNRLDFDALSKAVVTILAGDSPNMAEEKAQEIRQDFFRKKAKNNAAGEVGFMLDAEALKKLSYAVGMDIGISLKELSTDFDSEALLRAIGDVFSGSHSMMMSKEEVSKIKESFFRKRVEQHAIEESNAAVENKEEAKQFLSLNAKKTGVHVTGSGLQYEILKKGSGAKPSATDDVRVHYRGTLIDGTEFDSSYKRNQPIAFPLNGVIKGWTEGVQLMRVGAKYKFYIPSKLAYGERGAGTKIPPNAALIFEVELLGIE